MSSSRNKNTQGNYALEQRALSLHANYITYENAANGSSYKPMLAGNGLIHGRMGATHLSHNACDIESFLYGINSTNLVTPQSAPVAQLRDLHSLNVADRVPLIIPKCLAVEPNQRPRPL